MHNTHHTDRKMTAVNTTESIGFRFTSGDQFRTTDLLCIGFLSVLLLFSLFYQSHLPGEGGHASRLSTALLLYCSVTMVVRCLLKGHARAVVRIGGLAVLLIYMFDEMQYFQRLIFSEWLDDILVSFEYNAFGINPVMALQQYVHPYVTEATMFAYVAYIPLLPVLAFLVYRSGGDEALDDYLLNLSIIFLASFCGYIAFPVASPLYFSPGDYHVPLQGGFFTWCGEWLRHNLYYPGGGVPSAHCAAATGMLIMLYRHRRALFYVALPTLLLVNVATVYGRYHYLTDSLTGIALGCIAVRLSPALVRFVSWFVRLQRNPGQTYHPSSAETYPRGGGKVAKDLYGFLTNPVPVHDNNPPERL